MLPQRGPRILHDLLIFKTTGRVVRTFQDLDCNISTAEIFKIIVKHYYIAIDIAFINSWAIYYYNHYYYNNNNYYYCYYCYCCCCYLASIQLSPYNIYHIVVKVNSLVRADPSLVVDVTEKV